jgi:hypothetical protein
MVPGNDCIVLAVNNLDTGKSAKDRINPVVLSVKKELLLQQFELFLREVNSS